MFKTQYKGQEFFLQDENERKLELSLYKIQSHFYPSASNL
jgi:hypothetical protein